MRKKHYVVQMTPLIQISFLTFYISAQEKFRAGTHGYDNEEPLMRPIFMASGPVFKKNFTAQPFDNIDLYPLISQVMNLKQLTNNVRINGTMAGVEQLLLLSKTITNTGVGPRHLLFYIIFCKNLNFSFQHKYLSTSILTFRNFQKE